MGKYDFDRIIRRKGSGAMKVDGLAETFGREDLEGLWIADMDFAVAPPICDALCGRMHHPVYGYNVIPPRYWESIAGWLSRRHGWKVECGEITFIPGVVKGIALAINYFTVRGDKVVIQPPVYHPFKIVIEGNMREVVNNPLVPCEDGYRMDLDGLEKIFATEHPRMMILCNPHNPVGIQWSSETLRQVASLARRYGVIVVSDEIHGDLMLDGRRHYPFASVSEDAAAVAITLGAPSKTFNIAGLVSSWCVIKNPELREGFYHWLEVNEFNAPTFTAIIGTMAAYDKCEDWLDEMLDYISGNIEEADRMFKELLPEVKVVRPQASFLIWLDCRGLGLSHDELIELFVDKAHLALNDGAMFGKEGSGFMRLNVGCPREVLRRAIKTLAAAHKAILQPV